MMSAMASQITSLTIVYSSVYSGADQRKHQSSASLAFLWGIYRWPVDSPHKGPVTRKMFPFDDVTMGCWGRRCKWEKEASIGISACINIYIHVKHWRVITHRCHNREITLHKNNRHDYLSILRFQLIYVNKRTPGANGFIHIGFIYFTTSCLSCWYALSTFSRCFDWHAGTWRNMDTRQ